MTDLRKLAENATEGPWVTKHNGRYVVPAKHIHRPIGGAVDKRVHTNTYAFEIATIRAGLHTDNETKQANADYIAAANPVAVIELLDKLDEMRAAIIEAMHISLFTNAGENMNEILAEYFRENSNE